MRKRKAKSGKAKSVTLNLIDDDDARAAGRRGGNFSYWRLCFWFGLAPFLSSVFDTKHSMLWFQKGTDKQWTNYHTTMMQKQHQKKK